MYPNYRQTEREIAEFQATAVERLQGRTVTIGPLRSWISLFVFPILGMWMGFCLGGKAETVLWPWMILGASMGMIASIYTMVKFRASLVLDESGFRLQIGRRSVFVPWHVIRPERGFEPSGPVHLIGADPRYYDQITLLFDQIRESSGARVKTPAFRVLPMSQIAIQSQYACSYDLLRSVLLHSAARLKQLDPISWEHSTQDEGVFISQLENDTKDALVSVDGLDRLVVGRGNLSFPPNCFRCLETATTVLEYPEISPAVPTCHHCRRIAKNRISTGYWQLTGLFFFAVLLICFSILVFLSVEWFAAILIAFVLGVLMLTESHHVVSPLAKWYFSPVSVKRSNDGAKLTLSFDNVKFTKACVQHIVRRHS